MPLISGLTRTVAPNIYFILDDSTSMSWDYMPDDVGNDSGRNCFRNFGHNTVYYNPDITYVAPKNADGTSFLDSNTTFTAAKTNGFNAGSGTTNLSTTSSQTVTTTVSQQSRQQSVCNDAQQPHGDRHAARPRPGERHATSRSRVPCASIT